MRGEEEWRRKVFEARATIDRVRSVTVIQDWKVMPRGHSQTVVYS